MANEFKYGIEVNQKHSHTVIDFCEENKIEWTIWNFDKILIGNYVGPAEFEFRQESERDRVADYVRTLD